MIFENTLHSLLKTYCIGCLKSKLLTIIIVMLTFLCCSRSTNNNSATVHVKKNGDSYELYRNGKPFVIKGSSGHLFFRELKEAGANTVRLYDTTNLENKLDEIHRAGLAAVVNIPIPRYTENDTMYSNPLEVAKLSDKVRNLVYKHKNHPGLLYWILGNEINYPDWPRGRDFIESFNLFIDIVHQEDTNHPVSTAVGGFDRSKIISMNKQSSGLDLISINIFGELSTFQERKNAITLLWDGPYVFSEFGVNGPWEADKTTWMAPIEQTSTKKAEQYTQRYNDYINTINDGRCLGTLAFYWGIKQERTHTWFSTFQQDGKRNEPAVMLEQIWSEKSKDYNGPKLDYILLNGRGAGESIVLQSDDTAEVQIVLPESQNSSNLSITWEIRKENWNYAYDAVEKTPDTIPNLITEIKNLNMKFKVPLESGPYRVFLKIEDENYFATANIPFYALNATDGI